MDGSFTSPFLQGSQVQEAQQVALGAALSSTRGQQTLTSGWGLWAFLGVWGVPIDPLLLLPSLPVFDLSTTDLLLDFGVFLQTGLPHAIGR